MRKLRAGLVLLVCLLLAAAAPAAGAGADNGHHEVRPVRQTTVQLQILSFNDFHGQIEQYSAAKPTASPPAPGLGGAAYLATMLRAHEAENRNTLIISAGDLIGASPLTSALFHDEPTIEAANRMGVDIAVVGNHEFDEGWRELLRMEKGGCNPVDGCQTGHRFRGARFDYLAANVVRTRSGHTLFPGYEIKNVGGVKVAFIGVVLEGTPAIVSASATQGITFLDEADTINRIVKKLKRQHVEAIVVIAHQGSGPVAVAGDPCTGDIVDIVNRTDDEVDLFITGHTHNAYTCMVDGRMVTGTKSAGRMFTDIDLTLSKASGDVTGITAVNHQVDDTVAPAADLVALVDYYKALAAPLANQVIGSVTADILKAANAAGESALGDVIADAHLAATSAVDRGAAVIAFTNAGGIRTDIKYAEISGGELPGQVTYAEAFKVQPFANYLATITLTGAQIHDVLEQQWTGGMSRLEVSTGFIYSWSAGSAPGARVDPTTIFLNGVVIDPTASYRVTMNNFLADGGDGYAVFKTGTNRLDGVFDIDALVAYFGTSSPVAPGPQNRVTLLP
jgi:5'-nucleotidase